MKAIHEIDNQFEEKLPKEVYDIVNEAVTHLQDLPLTPVSTEIQKIRNMPSKVSAAIALDMVVHSTYDELNHFLLTAYGRKEFSSVKHSMLLLKHLLTNCSESNQKLGHILTTNDSEVNDKTLHDLRLLIKGIIGTSSVAITRQWYPNKDNLTDNDLTVEIVTYLKKLRDELNKSKIDLCLLSEDKISDYLSQIESIKLVLQEKATNTLFDSFVQFENLRTLEKLEQCFKTKNDEVLASELETLLSQRWETIGDTFLNYTNMPSNPVNQLCFNIAKILFPLPTNEDEINKLRENVGPYFLLMPTLKYSYDVYDGNIHRFLPHQFVLSDKQDSFIPVADCLRLAAHSDTGKLQHLADKDKKYPLLSESEASRITNHSTLTKSCYQAIIDLNQERLHGASLGAKLQKLATALRHGGAHGGQDGQEYNAGSAANEGILEFTQFWSSLSQNQRRDFYRAYDGLEEILGRLMRPNHADYEHTIYCVELLAEGISTLIQRNSATIFSNIENLPYQYLQDNVSERQRILDAEIAKEAYQVLPSTHLGQLLKSVVTMGLDEQEELFKFSKYKNALIYSLHMEIGYVRDLIKLLSIKNERNQSILNAKVESNGKTALILASETGQNLMVLDLINAGAALNEQDNNQDTALIWAVYKGHASTVKALLEYNLDVSIRNNDGDNALDIAIKRHPELIEPLLEKINHLDLPQQKEIFKFTLFNTYNESQIFNLLLHKMNNEVKAAILDTKNEDQQSMLTKAARAGNQEIVAILLQSGAAANLQDKWGDTPLTWAVCRGHVSTVKALLEYNLDVSIRNNDGDNALDLAIKGHPELIASLLEKIKQLDLHKQQEIFKSSLHHAYNNLKIFHELLDVMSDEVKATVLNTKNEERQSVLTKAAKAGNQEIVATLLQSGAAANLQDKWGDTPLTWAVYSGHVSTVKVLLEYNLDVSIRNNDGDNALDLAIKRYPELIASLLEKIKQLDLHEQQEIFKSSLHHAYNNLKIFHELLDVMSDEVKATVLNTKNEERQSVLTIAARAGNQKIVAILLQLGAAANLQDKWGDTPLTWAVYNGHVSTVKELLEYNLDVSIRNNDGDNAFDLAIKKHPELIELLFVKIKSLVEHIKSAEDFFKIMSALSIEKHLILFEAMQNNLPGMINNALDYYHIQYHLTPEQRNRCYPEIEKNASEWIQDHETFEYVFELLNTDQRKSVFEKINDKGTLDHIATNHNHIIDVLKLLPREQHIVAFEKLKDQLIQSLLSSEVNGDFFLVLGKLVQVLSTEQRTIIYDVLRNDIPDVYAKAGHFYSNNKSAKELRSLFDFIPDEKQADFLDVIKNSLKGFPRNLEELSCILTQLFSSAHRIHFFEALAEQGRLSQLIPTQALNDYSKRYFNRDTNKKIQESYFNSLIQEVGEIKVLDNQTRLREQLHTTLNTASLQYFGNQRCYADFKTSCLNAVNSYHSNVGGKLSFFKPKHEVLRKVEFCVRHMEESALQIAPPKPQNFGV